MRILFLSHYFPPEGNAPASRTYEHCVRWVRAGHEVTVVTCVPNVPHGRPYDGFRNSFRTQVDQQDGIRVLRTWTYLAPNAGSVRRILNYLSYMVSAWLVCLRLPRPDLVIATSPQFFCGWAGVLVSKTRRVPLVLEIRDIWPESIKTVGAIQNRWMLRGLEFMELGMYRAATHVVTVGRGYRDNILGKVPLQDRISLIYNGVDLEQFKRPQSLPAWPDPRLVGKFVCSYIGTIGMAHGLEVVVEAAAELKDRGRTDIAFCLVGDGASRADLVAAVNSRGLGDQVVFLGQRPKADVPKLLAMSDVCLIHLKKCELFGTAIPSKMFESMAMERPIIMGVDGEARDIVSSANAAISMEPGCPQSLVQAVISLADNPQLVDQLTSNARAFVSATFSRDVLARQYLKILESVHSSAEKPEKEPTFSPAPTRIDDECGSSAGTSHGG